MPPRLPLLLATTALGLAAFLPAPAALAARLAAPASCGAAPCPAAEAEGRLLRLAEDDGEDEGEDDDEGDDDEGDDDDDCEDDDDGEGDGKGGCATTGKRGPARAGTVPPPANGLFAPGKAPVAVTK